MSIGAALSGCSLNRTAARVTSGIIDDGIGAVFSESDMEYVKAALPANLQLMEILLRSDPKNGKLLVNAATGFCGYSLMLAESRAPQRMLAVAEAMFGAMPGGLAIVALLTTALFTAFTGASGVTIIALGGLLYPMLAKQGYPDRFSLGLLTTTGSLGLLFPPSLPIILYAIIAKINMDSLFRASLLPGVLLLAALSAYAFFTAKKSGVTRIPFSTAKLKTALRGAAWEIPLPFLIIGGIYDGWFTAGEAASVMSFYVLITEVFVYRDLNLKRDVPRVAVKSMLLVGAIFMVLGTALGFTNYLIDAEIPAAIFDWLHAFVSSKLVFLILLNCFLLVINMIEIFSAILIVVPIIVPIAAQYGLDPIHLGVIFLVNLEIGYMLPPLGLNLFLAGSRFGKPLPELYRATLPFLLILTSVLLLITYTPALIMK